MATEQHRLSADTVFSLANEALTESTLAVERDVVVATRLGRVEEAMHCFCCDPSATTRAQLTAAVTDFREARRSTALARWRGFATRPKRYGW